MKLLYILLITFLLFTGCNGNPVQQMSNSQDAGLVAVKRYVTKQKRWNPNEYRIEYAGKQSGNILYMITFLEDERRGVPGAGKSFEVLYDVKTDRIVREIHFQ